MDQKQTLRHLQPMSALPQKRTLIERVGMSALCQKRTYALQQLIGSLGQMPMIFAKSSRGLTTAGASGDDVANETLRLLSDPHDEA